MKPKRKLSKAAAVNARERAIDKIEREFMAATAKPLRGRSRKQAQARGAREFIELTVLLLGVAPHPKARRRSAATRSVASSSGVRPRGNARGSRSRSGLRSRGGANER